MRIFEKIKSWWDEKCPVIAADAEYGPASGVGGAPWYDRKSWAKDMARKRRKRAKPRKRA